MNRSPNTHLQPIIRIGKASDEQPTLVLYPVNAANSSDSVIATGFLRGMPVVGIINSRQPNGDPMTARLEIYRTGVGAPVEPVAVARPAETWSESPPSDPWAHEFHDTLAFHLRKSNQADLAAYGWDHAHGTCLQGMPKDLHKMLGFHLDLVPRPVNAVNPPRSNLFQALFDPEEPAAADVPRA